MSVHGRHLIAEDNQDVPVCTDCHGAHGIRDPRSAMFHVHAHEICARCHGDTERMARYGLSTNVLRSYLEDFHGHSNQLYAHGAGRPDRPLASCTDCHGTHDVHSLAGDSEAIRERVVLVCRHCHEDVPEAFADAWLSHYAPTLASAPIVWTTEKGFHLLYLLLLGGLALHVLLHLWSRRVRPPNTD
jgi:predicted CXXCH cytochrome family protein